MEITENNERAASSKPPRSGRRSSSASSTAVLRRAAPSLLVFAIALVFGLWGDIYYRHGLSADYYYRHDQERTRITSQDEYRVAFASEHFALSRYVQNWPSFEALPPPLTAPPIDIDFHARVTIEPGDPNVLGVDASGSTELLVDGRPERGPLATGEHMVDIHWEDRPSQRTHFELSWGDSPDEQEAIPRSRLRPAATSWAEARTTFWLMWSLVTLLFVGLAYWVSGVASELSRFARLDTALSIAIVVLGAGFRFPEYQVMPEYRENADELFAMWNGFSLLEDGTSRGWSLWADHYRGQADIEFVRQFDVHQYAVSPYFEHPPLLHVLVGAATHWAGTESWRETRLVDSRPVVIVLSLISLAMVILITRQLYPIGPAPWLAGIIYACLPFVVLQARVIKEESLMVPLEMTAIYCFLRWRNGGRSPAWLWAAAISCGLCPFTKVPGVAFIAALVMLVLAESDVLRAITVGAIGVGLTLLWPLFGFLINWEVFVMAQASQSGRPSNFNVFTRWFDDPLVNHNLIGRGWLIFLWLASLASLHGRARRDGSALIVPLVMYMLAISVGSGNWTFGWYAAPFYPILCIGAGAYIAELWDRPNLLGGLLFVTLFVFYGVNFTFDREWTRTLISWAPLRRWMSVALLVLLGPFCASQVWPRRWAIESSRYAIVAGMLTFVGLSAYFVCNYDVIYNVHRNYDRDAFYDR